MNTSMQLTIQIPHLWISEMQKKGVLRGTDEQSVHDALVHIFLDWLSEPAEYQRANKFPRLSRQEYAA